jgi:two-component system phosphate regulon sensor histidine kinase PhoR
MEVVNLSSDPRMLRRIAVAATLVAIAAVVVGFVRNPEGEALLAIGALLALASMLGIVRRLGASALESRREVRSLRSEFREEKRRLDERVQLLEEILDALDAGVIVCDTNYKVISANRSAQEMFGSGQPGRSLLEFTMSNELRALAERALSTGTTQEEKITLSHPSARHVLVRAIPCTTNRLLIVVADVSELVRLERVRTDFVANVSHELRTPLASIRALAETIAEEKDMAREEVTHHLHRIIGEVDRLTALSNDLLTLSEAESKPSQKVAVNLSQVAREIGEQYRPQAERKGLAYSLSIQDDVVVPLDRDQIVQVLANLLSNAIRYTPEGAVSMTLSTRNGSAILEVRDTGIGISREDLPRIFERFYRVDKARSRETGGTGLGLSIVKHIVNAHGGDVEVESTLGSGSKFTVRLPIEATPPRG